MERCTHTDPRRAQRETLLDLRQKAVIGGEATQRIERDLEESCPKARDEMNYWLDKTSHTGTSGCEAHVELRVTV